MTNAMNWKIKFVEVRMNYFETTRFQHFSQAMCIIGCMVLREEDQIKLGTECGVPQSYKLGPLI